MDPKDEEKPWREHHEKQPFVKSGQTFEHWAPAYRAGYEGAHKNPGKKFSEMETELEADYVKQRPVLPWDEAKDAARVAWDRLGGVFTPRDVSRGVRYD